MVAVTAASPAISQRVFYRPELAAKTAAASRGRSVWVNATGAAMSVAHGEVTGEAARRRAHGRSLCPSRTGRPAQQLAGGNGRVWPGWQLGSPAPG